MHLILDAKVPLPQELKDDLSRVQGDLHIVHEEVKAEEPRLVYSTEGLGFHDGELLLHLDFSSAHYKFYKSAGAKKEPILRAIGKIKEGDYLFDATAGTGRDALFFSQAGYRVVACERSPLMYLLLNDALRRSTAVPFTLNFGDSSGVIAALREKPAVAYVDPMFPEQKKSSLPRKEMQILRRWADDHYGEGLVLGCLEHVKERVVVKRPLKGEPLYPNPGHSVPGKLVRFDVYLSRKSNDKANGS